MILKYRVHAYNTQSNQKKNCLLCAKNIKFNLVLDY
jgi:hypothetical protein